MNCCVQTSVWFPDDPARKALIQRWAIAFVRCAMDHVREDCDLEPHLKVCCPEDLTSSCTVVRAPENAATHLMSPLSGYRLAKVACVQRTLLDGEVAL